MKTWIYPLYFSTCGTPITRDTLETSFFAIWHLGVPFVSHQNLGYSKEIWEKFFWGSVANKYVGKVTEAFRKIPSSFGAVVRKPCLGGKLPPLPICNARVKPPYLRYDKGYYWSLIGNRIRASEWYQNQRRWLTLKWPWAAMLSVALHTCFSEPTTKIWMKIDPYCKRQKCSPWILVSRKVSFMRIFAGVRWRRGVKWEWGVKNGDFRFFRSLYLPNLHI